jgi:hypothetical protein
MSIEWNKIYKYQKYMIGLNPNWTLMHDGHQAYNKKKRNYIIEKI